MLAEDPAGMENALAKLLLFLRLALASTRLWPSVGSCPGQGLLDPQDSRGVFSSSFLHTQFFLSYC